MVAHLQSLFHSLRIRLLFFTVLLLIPALILILLLVAQYRQPQLDAVEANVTQLAQLAASAQKQQIAATEQLLFALTQLGSLRRGESNACSAYFARLVEANPQYHFIAAVSADGQQVLCSSIPVADGVIAADRAYFQRVLESGSFAVGDFIIGRALGKPSVTFAAPVFADDGRLNAVVVAGVDLSLLSEWFDNVPFPPDTRLIVTDSQGTILAHYPSRDDRIGLPLIERLLSPMQAHQLGTFEAPGIDGEERIYAHNTLDHVPGGFHILVGVSKEHALADVYALQNFLVIGLVGGAILVAVFFWLGAGSLVIAPLEHLTSATQRMTHGDWPTRLPSLDSFRELDVLAASITTLAQSLAQREADIQQSTAKLHAEINIRKETEEKLRGMIRVLATEIEARRAAQRSDERKLRFLAMVSHELRTPLTSIKGFASTLLAPDVNWDSDTQNNFINIIDEEADNLLEMVEQLLDLTQLETGAFRLHPEATALEDILYAVKGRMEKMAAHHTFVMYPPAETALTLHIDRRRIRQVLLNLVGNAVKYSPHGSTITFTASVSGDRVRFDVSDQGMGIKPEDQAHIFKAFNRVNEQAVNAKGAGLGLAICKGIIEAHSGRIWLEHSSEHGTTISVELPAFPIGILNGAVPV